MSHSDLASLRGEPSYVWRAGQERRLGMMARWAELRDARVLVAGCGVGMYARQIRGRYTPHVKAFDIEYERVQVARNGIPDALVSAGEALPYAANCFDVVLSHEVIEHVADDRRSLQEMLRVTKAGGRILLFCPNRWYPFETHGHYWRGQYHFGNTPLINYLPASWRDKLAPHVRAYTRAAVKQLLRTGKRRRSCIIRAYTAATTISLRGWARRPRLCAICSTNSKGRRSIPGRCPTLS